MEKWCVAIVCVLLLLMAGTASASVFTGELTKNSGHGGSQYDGYSFEAQTFNVVENGWPGFEGAAKLFIRPDR